MISLGISNSSIDMVCVPSVGILLNRYILSSSFFADNTLCGITFKIEERLWQEFLLPSWGTDANGALTSGFQGILTRSRRSALNAKVRIGIARERMHQQ
jgi:hypothetical protein